MMTARMKQAKKQKGISESSMTYESEEIERDD